MDSQKPELWWETDGLAVTGTRVIKLKIPVYACIFLSLISQINAVSCRVLSVGYLHIDRLQNQKNQIFARVKKCAVDKL